MSECMVFHGFFSHGFLSLFLKCNADFLWEYSHRCPACLAFLLRAGLHLALLSQPAEWGGLCPRPHQRYHGARFHRLPHSAYPAPDHGHLSYYGENGCKCSCTNLCVLFFPLGQIPAHGAHFTLYAPHQRCLTFRHFCRPLVLSGFWIVIPVLGGLSLGTNDVMCLLAICVSFPSIYVPYSCLTGGLPFIIDSEELFI